jgi:hypothetical protein
MMYRSICTKCAHFRADESEDTISLPPFCTAFPQGIPDEIIRQGYDHRNPYDGDNGIMFEPDGPVDVAWIENVVNPPTVRNPARR